MPAPNFGRETLDRNKKLAGKRIVITGAASGMGAATTRLFAEHGAKLAIFDMNEAALKAVAAETGATPFVVDVSDHRQVADAIEASVKALGGLDGIVNVAGILILKPIAEITPEEQDKVLRVNTGGILNMIRSALPHLQASGNGTIVNFSSYGGYRPGTGLSVYGASKAGVIALAQSLIHDIGPKVRINTVCPGVIDTPMNRPRIDSGHISQEKMQKINQLQRHGQASELAEAVLFLSSDEASFVSNAVIEVSGGQLN